jgi:hypothetical protein
MEQAVKININGNHIVAAVIALLVWVFLLPAWPSLFVFILGQCAATYLTSFLEELNEAESHDQ